VRNIVFIARDPQAGRGRGGGGGGDQQTDPIRRAHGIGADAITLRVAQPARVVDAVAVPDAALPQPLILDAKPLMAGLFDQIGLPNSSVEERTSSGPGSDDGVGTGTGPGIGPGQGPGVGPGSLGGSGGEPYRPGGAVSAPRALVEVKPTYTSNALRSRIQGSVVLEFVVTRDGRPSQIRVVRSLDRELDQQAIDAASRWRFEPGRLAGDAVNVLVTLMLDFRIR
jgi:protein TonB